MKYLAIAMSVFYVIVGLGFLFTDMLMDMVPHGRPIIGGVITAYGFLRFYLWWRKNASQQA